MPKGILGKKLGMTQLFAGNGDVVPVTVIQTGPCRVVQKKTPEKDGYAALQIGFGDKLRNVNKPQRGHFAKAQTVPALKLAEIRTEGNKTLNELEPGAELRVESLFKEGDLVDVTGTSKGKGFAGTVKKHNFNRGPMSHGSMYHRRVGALAATDAARVFKNRPMAGRMGNERRTVQGLSVVKVDAERNLLLLKGSVPGINGSYVLVKESVKKRG
jgi:large subunit ribosomal protein L3